MGCVVYIIKANTVIDCKDGEACHMYNDDILTLEEADNRIICHIGHMIKADNLISIKVRYWCDSNLVGIYASIWTMELSSLNMVWFWHWCQYFNRKATSINSTYERLGKALCLALLFFHVFSGWDSTQHFFNYTKNQLYAIWMPCPIHEEVSWVFQLLSWLPNSFCIDTCTPILEKFISYVYTKNPDKGKNQNEVRLLQYSSSAKEGFQILLPS